MFVGMEFVRIGAVLCIICLLFALFCDENHRFRRLSNWFVIIGFAAVSIGFCIDYVREQLQREKQGLPSPTLWLGFSFH